MMADDQLFNNNDDGVVVGGVFVYTGGEQRVPRDVRRVRIAENVDTIPEGTFKHCRQLREVEGHNKIRKIEHWAFYCCRSLRRVNKMSGVVEIKAGAFTGCSVLSELEFDMLEIIGEGACASCNSLRSINMPSVRWIGQNAFVSCALTSVLFGEKLERIGKGAFLNCPDLRHIVIPLKDNIIIDDCVFYHCGNLSRVDVLAGGIIPYLHMESWRNEMEEEIDRINQTLPNIPTNEKAGAIREWIARVIDRMEHYKNEHQLLLKEAMTLLELALWKANLRENENDGAAADQEGVRVTRGRVKRARKDRCVTSGASIVIKNVLPFLALK
jgi:hypothetical protein